MRDIPWGPHHPDYFDTAEEFFGEVPIADLVRWSGVQHWTHEEGVALSFGFDPRVVTVGRLSNHNEHPSAAEFDRRMDLARRAAVAGQLSELPSPKQFIRWAASVGIIFPFDFALLIKSAGSSKAGSMTPNQSALTRRVKTLSQIALGLTENIYGLNPQHETIVTELREAGITIEIGSVELCLKATDDLYVNLPEVRQTLSKFVLGLAMRHFGYDPKASRNTATKKIVEALAAEGRSITDDTICTRLREAAGEFEMI
jgi:hypothetical protein